MATELSQWDDPFGRSLEPSYLSSFAATRGAAPAAPAPALATPSAPRMQTSVPRAQGSALSQFSQQGGDLSPARANASPLDPAAYDAKARSIARDLQAQGHQVKWSGEQLMVDGRPYIVAGAPSTALGQQTNSFERETGGSSPPTSPAPISTHAGYPPGYYEAGWRIQNGQVFDPSGHPRSGFGGATTTPTPPTTGQPAPAPAPAPVTPTTRTPTTSTGHGQPSPSPSTPGSARPSGQVSTGGYQFPAGSNLKAGDLIPGTNVRIPQGYYVKNGIAYAADGTVISAREVQDFLDRESTKTTPTPAPAPGTGGGGGGGGSFGGLPKVTPYTPGVIPTDTPQYTFDQIIDQGPAAQLTDQLMQQILRTPESMDPLTVDRMKAASKEELAQMAQSDAENLKGFGFANNLATSPWYGSEQMAGARARDNAIIQSNRNIDLTAAQTNMEDRRAAAGLGAAYQNQRTQQRALAADTQLRAAAVATDRLGMREAVKQKATELQISEQDVLADFIIGQAQVQADRYGIDVGAAIDREKLKQAGTEFMLDLALRKQQLAFEKSKFSKTLSEQKREFNLGFGLDLDRLQLDASQPPAAP